MVAAKAARSAAAHEASPAVVAHHPTALPAVHDATPELISVTPPGPSVPPAPITAPMASAPSVVTAPPSETRPPELKAITASSFERMPVLRHLTQSARHFIDGALSPASDFLYNHYWRVSVQGANELPTGGCVLVANHAGALPLDGPVLARAVRTERPELNEARWLTDDAVLTAPILGRLMKRLGALRASPATALQLLEEGRPVIVFPEGLQGLGKPLSERYQLKRFGRGGYVKLALKAKVPIVPVAIVGAEEALPLFARLPWQPFGVPYVPLTSLPLPAHWHIRIGTPVSLADAPEGAVDNVAYVEDMNDKIRSQVEHMLVSLLEHRSSIFS